MNRAWRFVGVGRMVLCLTLICLGGLVGCSLQNRVDDRLFQQLSVDRKLVLFDAENDVSMAVDARAQMQERLYVLRQERRLVADEMAWAAAAAASHDAKQASSAAQARRMWDLRDAYLRQSSQYLRRRLDVQKKVIDAAQARFELVKAQEALTEKLQSRDKIALPRFVAQLDHYQKLRDNALSALLPQQNVCEQSRTRWLAQRDEYVAHNIQKMGIVGADELAVWELW